ncbi:MAG TPA: hypothetical protein VKJ01_24045, partial [Candidatus Solibacter sp.]|nr:hypothetical protein [Candidatus Solibacter sp.]
AALAHQSASSLWLLKLSISARFPGTLLSFHSPAKIVALLPGIQVVGGNHSQLAARLRHDYGKLSARVGLTVVDKANLALNILFVNRNRIVR